MQPRQELKGRIERAKEMSSQDGVFTSETEFSEEMMDIRKDFVTIHGEMVLLKNYSSLNFAGLVKILKKYDKRTGELLQLPFTQLALHQPFFSTEPLTRLVRECEANLELLFPLEAEVVQSTTISEGDQSKNLTPNDMTNVSAETSSSPLGEDTVDIFRSTFAAMRTIRALKRESSTHNPLSFASLFGSQDNESNGAVTEENSPGSSPTLQNGLEANLDDDAHSPK
ncbi:SPX domain-containing protein 4 [Sarracenia purpurea var. burkii]